MKIFISHSSKNKDYGNTLVDLLISTGVNSDDIIFTSNDAHGIQTGKNIFDWLKSRISEKPFVIYLLSPDYYKSVACLNEMGAAWIVENNHAMIFTPDFDLNCYEFQNGALDPREMGFYINNENRMLLFIEALKPKFSITNNNVLINQKVKQLIESIKPFHTDRTDSSNFRTIESISTVENALIGKFEGRALDILKSPIDNITTDGKSRFYSDLFEGKLKKEEAFLARYIIDTDRFNLGTGWQESGEIERIKTWEDINCFENILSNNYHSVIKRLEMKKLLLVSEVTSHGNPKEMCLVENFANELLDPSKVLLDKLNEIVTTTQNEELPF
ncbi:toll/interleukin-1 receptor domain-containing protein [Adhaeribacter soli]|uniref:TIR domain-containing protein n=1 Tax=Adhaeribacter soli TaxID=2607655 RepID=A0A5N1J466_9BACT|nr:toll/interleukin-1 receptor domain-containing protein [Adhaeribacter soli]KAA9340875.1 TIR domain-containing protein [Adhaeribacter soli]